MEVLKAVEITKEFGGIQAVTKVSFAVEAGERLAIIGPNGAGKTTLFNMIAGQYPPTSGQIFYMGREITQMPAHQRIHLGMGRSFQINSLFGGLSVMDNMLLAIEGTKPSRYNMLRPLKGRRQVVDKASEILRSFNLWDLRNEKVSTISYGDQRRLEIALSMASDPKVLLLDEPNCGLTAAENVELSKRISNLGKDIALVFIAHDMDLVFSVATRVMLLHYGELIIQGKPEDIKGNEMVKEIYLGKCKKI